MKTKELLLMLNLKSDLHKVQYVLEYDYSFDNRRQRIYSRSLIMKFINGKLHSRQKINNFDVDNFLLAELKLYQ